MGIGIVLLFWAFIGTILAILAALILGGATTFLTRGVAKGRKGAIFTAVALPFICLAWTGIIFTFQAVVNEVYLKRDAGLGDTWRCPLQNDYALLMIDVTDHGWVYNSKTQPGSAIAEQEDAVSGVRSVQVAGQYILGGFDSKSVGRLDENTDQVDGFFIIDTQTGRRATFFSYEALAVEAQRLGIKPKLVSTYDLYSEYRFTKFDVFVGFLLLLLPLALTCLLAIWIARLRRTRALQSGEHAL